MSISDKKNKTRVYLGYAATIALTALFLYFAFKGIDYSKLIEVLKTASFFWAFMFIFITLLAHLTRAARWKSIMESLKPTGVSLLNVFGSLMVGYAANCAAPRFGEVARAVALGKWEKVSRSAILGTIIVERAIDVLTLALAVVISAMIWGTDLQSEFPWLKTALLIISALLLLAIALFSLTIFLKDKFYKLLITIVGKFSISLAQKIGSIFNSLVLGFASLKGAKNYSLTVFYSAAIVALYALSSYIAFFIMEFQAAPPPTFAMGWIVMSLSMIGVMIPTPGATGSYHTIVKAALVVLYGFTEEDALAYAFVTHILVYLLSVILGTSFYFYLNKKNASKIDFSENLIDSFSEDKL